MVHLLVVGVGFTLSVARSNKHQFHTFGHLNGPSSFNICHGDLTKVPFNSELLEKLQVAFKTVKLPTCTRSTFDVLSPKG